MSTYNDCLTQIKSNLDSVSNIGMTHNRIRLPKGSSWTEFLSLFKTTISTVGQIRGWMITSNPNQSLTQVRKAAQGQHQRTLRFKLIGVMGLDDSASTEVTFRELAESVIDAFDADPKLGGVAQGSEPAQMPTFDAKNFGGVLCHYCEIDLEYRVMKQITYS